MTIKSSWESEQQLTHKGPLENNMAVAIVKNEMNTYAHYSLSFTLIKQYYTHEVAPPDSRYNLSRL